jgi:tetratricopeptide (TPR) repeat protein
MKLSTTCSVLLALLALAPRPGRATDGGGDPTAKLEADEHFSRGQELAEAGEYTRAAAAFERAYEIYPHQAVLANIAMCYDKAGKLAQAVIAYRRYLSNPVDAGKNTKMQERLRELEAMIGELDIECAEPDCRITVDGVDRGLAPLTVVVLPGAHKIEAFAGERRVALVNGRVGRGEVAKIELSEPGDADPTEPPGKEPVALETAPDDGVSLGAPFWVATGVGVAAGVTTIVFGALTVKEHDRYEAADRLDEQAKQDGERYRLITNVMIGVTGAAAATATALAIHALVTDGDEEQVALTTGPGLGVGVVGKF